jgi:TRAP-type transport system periplasmic protein
MKHYPRRSGLISALALALTTLTVGPLAAQEVTLKAVNAFQEGTYYARNFERFVKKVNEEGKGVVQIS